MPFEYHPLTTDDDMSGFINEDYLSREAQFGDEYEINQNKDNIIEDAEVKKHSVKRVFGYPISIPFIISNEFCERFSYYGMRTILMIYMTDKLKMGTDEATNWYHEFVALCFAAPLLGAIIADVFIGKFYPLFVESDPVCFC